MEGNSSMNSSINNLSTKVILAEVADMRTELERVQKNVEKDREDLMKELKNVSDEFQEYKIRHDDLDYQISTMNELRQVNIKRIYLSLGSHFSLN